jgi:hypothetical protein
MSGSNGPPRRFRIDSTPAIVQKTQRLHEEARQTGRGSAFAAAMRRLRRDLQARPRDCGEPLRIYKNSQMELRVVSERPAILWFVVHQTRNEVVVLDVELMPVH